MDVNEIATKSDIAELKSLITQLLKQNNRRGNCAENSLEDLITEEEACKILGIARSTLYGWKWQGKIMFYKPEGSKKSFFKRSELLKFMSGVKHKSNADIEAEAEAYCAIKRSK